MSDRPASPALEPFDIATVAAGVNAKDPFAGLSKDCQAALNKIIQSNLMTCLPMDAIIKLMGQPALLAELQKDPLHALPKLKPTFDDACSVTKCKDADVQNAAATVLGGCATDLAAKVPIAELIFAGLVIYTPAIDIICFKDHAADYCLFETDAILLSLPPPPPGLVIPGLEKAPPLLASVAITAPSNVCTPCNKAIINTFFDYYKKTPIFEQVLASIGYDDKKNGFLKMYEENNSSPVTLLTQAFHLPSQFNTLTTSSSTTTSNTANTTSAPTITANNTSISISPPSPSTDTNIPTYYDQNNYEDHILHNPCFNMTTTPTIHVPPPAATSNTTFDGNDLFIGGKGVVVRGNDDGIVDWSNNNDLFALPQNFVDKDPAANWLISQTTNNSNDNGNTRSNALPIQIQRNPKHSQASPPMSSEEYQRKLNEELEKVDFEDITVSELKEMLRQRGKPATGKKAVLMQRLQEEIELDLFLQQQQQQPSSAPATITEFDYAAQQQLHQLHQLQERPPSSTPAITTEFIESYDYISSMSMNPAAGVNTNDTSTMAINPQMLRINSSSSSPGVENIKQEPISCAPLSTKTSMSSMHGDDTYQYQENVHDQQVMIIKAEDNLNFLNYSPVTNPIPHNDHYQQSTQHVPMQIELQQDGLTFGGDNNW
ncbi:8102_t:CDS:2 [Entrophospora sp. SA101]|nr:8102_t:CDS:2 [Entrophospora sp. SA101]